MRGFILVCIFIIYSIHAGAQIKSSHDGFYKADSVFYELQGADSFKYCVNCYTADSLHAYKGGVWLYSREHTPNTWENSRFSKKESLPDSSGIRADVVKANTIWVRIFKGNQYTDQYHLVFLGSWRPKTTQLISINIDSTDFLGSNGFYGPGKGMPTILGYTWNYDLEIEKKCFYQVFSGPGLMLEAQQTSGLEISAEKSADYPDRAMQLNADKALEAGKALSLGKSLSDSLGANIKVLRLMVGGSNHRSNIIANEIAADVIARDMGGERSTVVCVFVNGSFWTYALAKERIGPNHIANVLNVPIGQVVNARIHGILPVSLLKKSGALLNPAGNGVYALSSVSNVSPVYYDCYDTMQFRVDTSAGYNAGLFDELCNVIHSGSNAQIAAIIDRENFYRYALSVWFFRNSDAWGNHIIIAKAGDMRWKLFADHYDFASDQTVTNDWDKYFTNYKGNGKGGLPWMATNSMLSYDKDYFCLVFEDELNTTYNAERTVPIALRKISSVRPCIDECSKAWWPNDWVDSLSWDNAVSKIVPFLEQRPNAVAEALPKIFLTGADTLLELKDRKDVAIKFDQVPGKGVTVKLNSLEIKSNFTGKYYPKPDLRISLVYDQKKYEFVKWAEYPNAAASFTLSANKPVTLTPVLKLKQ